MNPLIIRLPVVRVETVCSSVSLHLQFVHSRSSLRFLDVYKRQVQTVTGSLVKVLGQVDERVRLGLLESSHQMLVADIADEVILGTDIMNAYGFVVDLRENVLTVGQEKIKLCMAKMTGSTNHSIKHVALVEEKVNTSGQDEPSLLQAETEEELAEEVPICLMTK